ncbi:MAG: hypothetical protein IJS08_13700 [Victivallales bacterium]|nr:hypothetical protein [Victivallales bacterium]
MIIHSIDITEGNYHRHIDFDDKINLVHSTYNTQGKTTLLRLLLYSLGYNIPGTRRFNISKCDVYTELSCEKLGRFKLKRDSNSCTIITIINDKETTYVLPGQLSELHKLIFGTENENLINNLLGAFYIDQEKGWTLLNRGVVIGNIHFNIEELIRGLSDRSCTELIEQEMKLSIELGKFLQMRSVSKYQQTIVENGGTLATDGYDEKIDIEIEQLSIRQNELKKELSRIDKTINDNKAVKRFIAEMKLLIRLPNGEQFAVTEDSIVGLNDSINFLIAKRKMLSLELTDIGRKISTLITSRKYEEKQLEFWKTENITQLFDKQISTMPLNPIAIENNIKQLQTKLSEIRKQISDKTKIGNPISKELYDNVLKYANELGLGDSSSIAETYIFTSNLKELTGAILHKTVFSFRLAYILAIQKALNIKLPIILDSPSGKEIDKNNIQLMINILERDFADNQIIIASIFNYQFKKIRIIEIQDRLVNQQNSPLLE